MGEIADVMLDGSLCETCGVDFGTSTGFPRRCCRCRNAAKKREATMSKQSVAPMNERLKPLFSKTLRPGGKLFYLDVYPSRNGWNPYLSLCENRKNKEGGLDRIRIFVNAEAVPELRDALDEIHEFLENYTPSAPKI